MTGCCGQSKPTQDYMITYKDGSTERVAADQGVITVRQKIIKGGGGTFRMVPKQ
jgi:hypothetical protein